MRIAHLETGRHFYGGAQQVLQLMDALAAAGHANTLFAVPDSEIIASAVLRGHKVVPVALAGDHDLGFLRRFSQALSLSESELLHVHSRRGGDTFGGLVARRLGLPAVLSRRVDNPLSRWGARARFWPYQRIIAISEAIKRVLLDAGVSPEKLLTIVDAIATDALVLSPEKEWFREEFGLPVDCPVIGVVAQFIERKGHADLLSALPLVLGDSPDCHVVFFGRGALEQELREQVAHQKLHRTVHFAGFRQDLARIMPCLDMVVHPALAEGMGVAVLEAGAAALPVVAYAAGGVREVIQDGVTGRLVAPGDTVALADAIRELLADPEQRQRYGIAARRRVEQDFSMELHVDRHLSVYRELLGADKT